MSEQPHSAPPLAARYGLVRPAQGKYVAGVGAALGRATRTDPVLWRVVLAVLVCFAGLGALIYLLVWLLTPEEGDTGSPLESLLGRGRSSTSPALTGLLGIVVVGLLSVILPRPFYLMLGAALVVALVLLINRAQASPAATGAGPAAGYPGTGADQGGAAAGAPGPGGAGAPGTAPGTGSAGGAFGTPPWPAPGGADATPPPPTGAGAPAWSAPPGPAGAGVPVGAGATGRPPPPGARPVPTGPGYQPPGPAYPSGPAPAPTGYRPPFAPHGPFGGPPPPPPPPPPPRRPPERSRLAALVLFAAVAVLGVLGVLDLLQVAAIPVAAYLAAALVVVGAGLVVGAWWGRARVLIALGAVLALALPVAHAAETWDPPRHVAGDFIWVPADQTELEDEYSVAFGSGVLDLRQIDPAGSEIDIKVRVSFGEMTVLVPDDPAVTVTVTNNFAGVQVFGESSEGLTREVFQDPGSGDPAGGRLRLDLDVQFGEARVNR